MSLRWMEEMLKRFLQQLTHSLLVSLEMFKYNSYCANEGLSAEEKKARAEAWLYEKERHSRRS